MPANGGDRRRARSTRSSGSSERAGRRPGLTLRSRRRDGVRLEVGEIDVLERRHVRRLEDHAARMADVECLLPAVGAHAPLIARTESPANPYCGIGVIRSLPCAVENSRKSSVTRQHTVCMPGSSPRFSQHPVAVVAGHRIVRARLEFGAEHVALHRPRSGDSDIDTDQFADAVGDRARHQHDHDLSNDRLRYRPFRETVRSPLRRTPRRPRRSRSRSAAGANPVAPVNHGITGSSAPNRKHDERDGCCVERRREIVRIDAESPHGCAPAVPSPVTSSRLRRPLVRCRVRCRGLRTSLPARRSRRTCCGPARVARPPPRARRVRSGPTR